MATTIKNWFCELCKLQFDKKVVFDLHQKLVHGIDSIRLIRVKEKRAQFCNTENSMNKQQNNVDWIDTYSQEHQKNISHTFTSFPKL